MKKYMLRTLAMEYDVITALYDGFTYRLKLYHRPTSTYLCIKGNQNEYAFAYYEKKEEEFVETTMNIPAYKFAEKLCKYMKKRMSQFKDPFKNINGWS